MSQERLETARRLMQKRRYDAARDVLAKLYTAQATELLAEIDRRERSDVSLLRPPYGCLLLLGLLIPLALGAALFALASGTLQLPQLTPAETQASFSALLTAASSQTPRPSATPTDTATATLTDAPSDTPTSTDTPTLTATPTRDLPPTWTRTTIPTLVIPDATGTALVAYIATGEALVAATQTMAVRNAALIARGTQVLGIVGTPDAACMAEARTWWRDTRLIAADTFFNLLDDYDAAIALALEQPDNYGGLTSGFRVDFLEALREEASRVVYPACAHTAREMLLAYMQQRILYVRSAAAGDTATYEAAAELAQTYASFLDRELQILSVPRS